MKTNFHGKIVSNHSSFIRIHLNSTEQTQQLILPVEIEVCSEPGLYSTENLLDFGTIVPLNMMGMITVGIKVFNTGNSKIIIRDVEFETTAADQTSPESQGFQILFDGPIIVEPNQARPENIGTLRIGATPFRCFGLCSGKIVIKTLENDRELKLSYVVRSFDGGLFISDSSKMFLSLTSSKYHANRPLTVVNHFDFPILLNDAIISYESSNFQFVKAENFSQIQDHQILLRPKEQFFVGNIFVNFDSHSKGTNNEFETSIALILKTNVTDFQFRIGFSNAFLLVSYLLFFL